jgi:uncharacterized protein (DUF486 family)
MYVFTIFSQTLPTQTISTYQSWRFAYFPISGNLPYDKFGHVYDIARVLTSDNRFDLEAYNAYSPLFLPATYAMTYLVAFALSTCVIVHIVLYHGPSLLNGIKKRRVEPDDIHVKLMRNYPEVPDWWYLSISCVCFVLAVVVVEVSDRICVVCVHLFSLIQPPALRFGTRTYQFGHCFWQFYCR